MPIKGMTTAHQPGAGLPRLGKLVKGAERTQEDLERKRPGKDLTYFRVKWDAGYEHLDAVWRRLYGDEPTVIPGAYLMAQDVDAAFGSWMEEWGSGGLLRRCNGEQQVRWFDREQGRTVDKPIPCAQNAAQTCACKQVGRLNFILLALIQEAGSFGYLTLETHSSIDIRSLFSTLKDVEALYRTTVGIPFVLTRLPKEIEQPEIDRKTKRPTGKRIHVTKSLVQLRLDPTYVQQQMVPALMGEQTLSLPRSVDASTGEIVSSSAAPALPTGAAPRGPQWTNEQATAWADRKAIDYSLSPRDLLDALGGISRWGEWQGSAAEADLAVDRWLDAQIGGDAQDDPGVLWVGQA